MSVIDAVSKLTRDRGMAVICTIHQPSAELFTRFARILILQPVRQGPIEEHGGRVSYFGEVSKLEGYCKDQHLGILPEGKNIADFALEALGSNRPHPDGKSKDLVPAEVYLGTEIGQQLLQDLDDGIFKHAESDAQKEGRTLVIPTFDGIYAASWTTQLRVLMDRSVKCVYRDRSTLQAQIGATVIMGFLIGTLYFQLGDDQSGATNRISVFFLTISFINFTSNYKVGQLVSNRASFYREKTANMYKGWVYYMSTMVADALLYVPKATLYTLFVYFMCGFRLDNNSGPFWGFYFILILCFFQSLSLAELFAFSIKSIETAQSLYTLVVTIMFLFCGFMVQRNSIPDYYLPLYYVNLFRYPLYFFCHNELHGLSFNCPNNDGAVAVPLQESYVDANGDTVICDDSQMNNLNCFRYYCPIESGDDVLEAYDMLRPLEFYAGIMLVNIVGLRVISIFVLQYVNHVSK